MGQKAIIGGVERTLEHRPPNTIHCDIEGCDAETYVERYYFNTAAMARAEAAAEGWGFVDGRDLCPKHFTARKE